MENNQNNLKKAIDKFFNDCFKMVNEKDSRLTSIFVITHDKEGKEHKTIIAEEKETKTKP